MKIITALFTLLCFGVAPAIRAELKEAPAQVPEGVSIYFSDEGSLAEKIINVIDSAKVEILVNMRCLTNPALATAIVRAQHERRVMVYVLLDRDPGVQNYLTPTALSAAGIDVRLANPKTKSRNRYMVIDGEMVVTGSYEWTMTAERNSDENIIMLRNPPIADAYVQHFRRAMGAATQVLTNDQPSKTP